MKDLEITFFILSILTKPYIAFSILVDLGYNKKQLNYYICKWVDKGFLNYGTSAYSGWFEYSAFNGKYKEIFKILRYYIYDLPQTELKAGKAKEQIITDLYEVEFYNNEVRPFKEELIKMIIGGLNL